MIDIFDNVVRKCMRVSRGYSGIKSLSFEDAGEAVNDIALSTLSGWRALGLGTNSASPLKNQMTAQRAVERLEKHRGAGHQAYSRFAQFYPFR